MTMPVDILIQQVCKATYTDYMHVESNYHSICIIFYFIGIPNATVAHTDGPSTGTEIAAFLRASDSMHATGGGDGPERQLRALLATLDVKDSDGIPVMIPGSHIVLLTDALSHDVDLLQSVIDQAVTQKVCISFFLSQTAWVGYQNISDATGGTVVSSIDRTSFATFNAEHEATQCASHYGLDYHARKRRLVPDPPSDVTMCKYFTTSLFTSTVIVTGQTTQDSMIVTKPNGAEVRVFSNIRGEKIFRDSAPQSGQWSVCVSTGTLMTTVETTESMSATVKYLKMENSTEFFLEYTPPLACRFCSNECLPVVSMLHLLLQAQ